MTVLVRPVNLEKEREDVLDILNRNLQDIPHAVRFDWLYCSHPGGPAWAWFACRKETGKEVGVASVFPRALWVGDKVQTCGQVGDFAIDKSHRSLGPALLLQRATFEPVNRGVLALCYDCPPHEQGMSTFCRLGMQANTRMYRYSRMLRARRHITRRLGRGRQAQFAARLADMLLALGERKHSLSGLDISIWPGPFGEEFSRLDEQIAGNGGGIRARRRAEDLNWRYRQDPLHRYEVLTARVKGELRGFVVFLYGEEDVYHIDLFGSALSEIGPPLLDAMVARARERSAETVQSAAPEKHELAEVLAKAGFKRRSAGAWIVAYAQPKTETAAILRRGPWFFQQVDIMI
jgi:hypothetical protein